MEDFKLQITNYKLQFTNIMKTQVTLIITDFIWILIIGLTFSVFLH